MELFPHQFSQYLLSEVGFSKCETMGCPTHTSRGFQRPIKMFFKEDPSFDTPIYSANTSTHESATPKYVCKFMPNRPGFHIERFNSERFRLPDSLHLQDEFSVDSKDSSSPPRYFPYETPSSVNSPESGFSEGLFPRRYPPIAVPRLPEESDSNSQEGGGTEEDGDKVRQELVTSSPEIIENTEKQETAAEDSSDNIEVTVKPERVSNSSDNTEISVKEEITEDNSNATEISIKQEVSDNSLDNKSEVLLIQEKSEDISNESEVSIKQDQNSDKNNVISLKEIKEDPDEEMALHEDTVEAADENRVVGSSDTENTAVDSSLLVEEDLGASRECGMEK